MAGGKETPRQKMIGMMYLVLTALLALNVSKQVLEAFAAIEPEIACYGCQKRYTPPITGVICDQGDPYNPPCIQKFNMDKFKKELINLTSY